MVLVFVTCVVTIVVPKVPIVGPGSIVISGGPGTGVVPGVVTTVVVPGVITIVGPAACVTVVVVVVDVTGPGALPVTVVLVELPTGGIPVSPLKYVVCVGGSIGGDVISLATA